MYQLNKFCNIIFDLRKERGWTQTMLAEKLNIAPQSISKWECGIGYPNVTLFPVIAELFHVPIGVLFGEGSEEGKVAMDLGSERNFVFEPLEDIEIMVGNPCDIEVKDGVSDHASLHVEGDLKFVEYISAEIIDGKLYVNIKNPTGSDTHWNPYDRGDYRKANRIVIHSGAVDSNCCITNYLDLVLSTRETIDHMYKWTCRKENASG